MYGKASTRKPKLMKNALGFWAIVGQTIAFTAPLASVVTSLTGAALYARGALPLAILISVISGIIWVNTPYQYSSKVASSGGFYTFTKKALGRTYGLFDGLIYLMFEYTILANTTLFFAGVLLPSILSTYMGISTPKYLWIPILIIFVLLFTALPYFGVKPSVRYALFGAFLEIGLLLVLGISIIILAGHHNTVSVFIPHLSGGIAPLFEGIVLGTFLMTGASGAVYMGEEAKMPKNNIKKAMIVSFIITGATFLMISYAFTIGWGVSKMGDFATKLVPGLILANEYLGFPFLIIMVILLFNSIFVSMVSPLNVLGRIGYSLSEDHALYGWFAKIHPKYKTPSNTILFMGLTSIIASVAAGLILGPFYGYIFLITLAGLALFAGHIMSDFALPFFFRAMKEFKFVWHLLLPAVSLFILLFGIYYSVYPPLFPYFQATILMGILLVLIGIYVIFKFRSVPKQIKNSQE